MTAGDLDVFFSGAGIEADPVRMLPPGKYVRERKDGAVKMPVSVVRLLWRPPEASEERNMNENQTVLHQILVTDLINSSQVSFFVSSGGAEALQCRAPNEWPTRLKVLFMHKTRYEVTRLHKALSQGRTLLTCFVDLKAL